MAHPDVRLLNLGAEFEIAVLNYHCENAVIEKPAVSPAEQKVRYDQAYAHLDQCRAAIVAERARTLAGFRVKARAAAWPYGLGEAHQAEIIDLDDAVVLSIIRDLLAVGLGPRVCGGLTPQRNGSTLTGTMTPLFLTTHKDIDEAMPSGGDLPRRLHADLAAQMKLLGTEQAA